MVESTVSQTVHEDSTFETHFPISLATAEYRDAHIDNVAYYVDLTLPKGEWYTASFTVSFRLL